MRSLLALAMIASSIGCARISQPAASSSEAIGFPVRSTFTLTRLDDRTLPTGYSDPHGRFTLKAGELTLAPNGDLWLTLDLVPEPDSVGGRTSRTMLVESYRRVGADSLIFPVLPSHLDPRIKEHSAPDHVVTPEFFGRRRGSDLLLIAQPLPPSAITPGVISIAHEYGGRHAWTFKLR